MADELDVRDDREEAHEEGGDDEVSTNAITHDTRGRVASYSSSQVRHKT